MDEHYEGEAPCRPGGNYGLCKTHPTCEMVHRMLSDYLRRISALETASREVSGHLERWATSLDDSKFPHVAAYCRELSVKLLAGIWTESPAEAAARHTDASWGEEEARRQTNARIDDAWNRRLGGE